jgi:formylglycine-generating enzyme required for sulfatase activity
MTVFHSRSWAVRLSLAVLSLAIVMVGCAPEAPPDTPVPTATRIPATAAATSGQTTSGQATAVPTQAGPTPTPLPTSTPRPAATPTSAPSNKPNTVYITGGTFTLGSDAGNEDETPQQEMVINSYNMDLYPVTNAQYKEFVDAIGHVAPRHWKEGAIPAGLTDHPVVWVTWADAEAFCTWAGKRLPTEFEWEKAARGEDGRAYPWGNTFDVANCNTRESNLKTTSPVGSYPGGASPYGLLDMAGNVWQWTADWYQGYRGTLYELTRYGQQFKVLRGGSWYDGQDLVRTTTRKSFDPGQGFSTIGFRCAE